MLSILAFYGSLVFGFGFGMVAFYRIGRFGWTQFAYWLGGLGAAGSVGGLLGYSSTIFGPLLSKLWLALGLPAFVLDVVLARSGNQHSPLWLHDIGLEGTTERLGAVLAGCVITYALGRVVGSRQRDFNRARFLYEGAVARKGYWFDHRAAASHYEDPGVRDALRTSDRLYDRILEDLTGGRGPHFMAAQNQMILHYQRALLFCTLRRYGHAKAAINQARQVKESLPASQWEPHENDTFESQLLFLEGEVALVEGRNSDARGFFTRSQAIDRSLNDQAGVSKNQERLDLVEAG